MGVEEVIETRVEDGFKTRVEVQDRLEVDMSKYSDQQVHSIERHYFYTDGCVLCPAGLFNTHSLRLS